MIPIYAPYLPEKYRKSAHQCIDSGWISNHGIYIKLASDKLSSIIGSKYCILMSNGTCATHALFMAVRFKHPTIRTFYLPDGCFIAPHNCALMEFGRETDVQFKLLKMDNNTMNMCCDEESIATLDNGSCVVVVHNYGGIVNVPRLKTLRPDLIFIEDNCEGLFGTYGGVYSGTAALCSSASFYGNKILTTGEGGAFFTNDVDIYNYISRVYSHGMTNHRYVHDVVGFNYRMTNVQAAFLYDQLMDLPSILRMKRFVFETYTNIILNSPILLKHITFITSETNTIRADWIFSIKMSTIGSYDDVERYMSMREIQIRPFFHPIYAHQHLREIYPITTPPLPYIGVMLPSSPDLKYDDIKYILLNLEGYIINN